MAQRIHETKAGTYPKHDHDRRKRQSLQITAHAAPERAKKARSAPSSVQLPANIAAALMEIYFLSEEILSCGHISDETADDLRFLVPIIREFSTSISTTSLPLF